MANLKTSARRFARLGLPILEAKLVDYKDGVESMPRWQPHGDSSFILRPTRLSPVEACLAYEAPRLSELPGTDALRDALERDQRLAPFMGHLVGTPMYGTLMDEDRLIRGLLWEYVRARGTLIFDETTFSRAYETWLSRSTAREEAVQILVPLHPFGLSGALRLDGDLALGQLNDEEVSTCLVMGAIHSSFAGSGLAMVNNRAAVRINLRERRGRHDEYSEEDRKRAADLENEALVRADEVIQSLRVFKSGRVAIYGHVILRPNGSQQGGPVGSGRLTGTALELTDAEAPSYREFWKGFRAARRNRALDAAIRRFGYAGERSHPDDEIVDLVAALEALLLADLQDRGELGYRTRLRGAVFIERSGLTRREVQRQIGRAYRVRSAVAHGGTPDDKDLRSPQGTGLRLPEFVSEIEELVRLALKKAIDLVGRRNGTWPPDWDALILDGDQR